MRICHIGIMPTIKQMGSITQEIYNRCDGEHSYSVLCGDYPEAEIYLFHCFKNQALDMAMERVDGKVISLIHSSDPCSPVQNSNAIVTLSKAWRDYMYAYYGIETTMIRGAIDLTEFLKIKQDYSIQVFGKISRAHAGKNHAEYNNIILRILNSKEDGLKEARARIIMDNYKKLPYIEHDRCEYAQGVTIEDNVMKAHKIGKMNIYADAHSTYRYDMFTETFCVALLESMACGCAPIILGQYQPAMRELVDDAGIIAEDITEFEKLLKMLCRNKNARECYGNLARERAQKYNLNRMIKEWNDLFRDVLSL